VLGIDTDPKVVQSLAGRLTHMVEADSTDEEAMRQLSVHEFDRAVIGIGNDLEASILSASVLLSLKVRDVWAKAISESHARILSQIGVHHVVRPEHDMGKRVAHLVRGRMLDYIEFDDGFAIVKTRPPASLLSLPLAESRPRSKYGITIVGVKRTGQDFTHATPDTVVEQGDLIIVSGPRDKVERFSELA
jgi:trk system potassium uptake protein TrkA